MRARERERDWAQVCTIRPDCLQTRMQKYKHNTDYYIIVTFDDYDAT